jgi:uncharacterized protein (TIGR02145 family)
VTSSGVTGLTATLAAGNFASGADSLSYTITGTPDTAGTASFALEIGGQSCSMELTVGLGTSASSCWALVAPTDTLYFLCHNLASANIAANPYTPGWEIVGGYWQWGRKGPDASEWLNTNTSNFAHGPTGEGPTEANEGAISGWSTTHAPNGSWQDSTKTAQDSCPAGYRVPTKAQWEAVANNNTQSIVGTWSASVTNYNAGCFFGPDLMLPTTGYRNFTGGAVSDRGTIGDYWSSTEYNTDLTWTFFFTNNYVGLTYHFGRRFGFNIGCVAE